MAETSESDTDNYTLLVLLCSLCSPRITILRTYLSFTMLYLILLNVTNTYMQMTITLTS